MQAAPFSYTLRVKFTPVDGCTGNKSKGKDNCIPKDAHLGKAEASKQKKEKD